MYMIFCQTTSESFFQSISRNADIPQPKDVHLKLNRRMMKNQQVIYLSIGSKVWRYVQTDKEVLTELHKEAWAPIFRFHSFLFEDIYDTNIFEAPVWYRPDSPKPVPLFTP